MIAVALTMALLGASVDGAAAETRSALWARVRDPAPHAPPPRPWELSEALPEARAAAALEKRLDAHMARRACPPLSLPEMEDAASAALLVGVVDLASGASTGAASLVRAADLAAHVRRFCGHGHQALAERIATRSRTVAWWLAEAGLLDGAAVTRFLAAARRAPMDRAAARELALIDAGLRLRLVGPPPALPATFPEAEGEGPWRYDGARLWLAGDDGRDDRGDLRRDVVFFVRPRAVPDVVVRCVPTADPDRFTVDEEVAWVLERRAAEEIARGARTLPAIEDGRVVGLRVLAAGPAARSCGVHDDDILLDVNGVPLATAAIDEGARRARPDGVVAVSLRRGVAVRTIFITRAR
jgi:hypothetical protein